MPRLLTRYAIATLTLALACSAPATKRPGGPAPEPAPAPATTAAGAPLPAPLQPAAWLIGDWKRDDGRGTEHWVAAGPALFGVGFTVSEDGARTVGFEAMIIDAQGERLRFRAMPGGQTQVAFAEAERGEGRVGFANPAHDFPQTIAYARGPGDGALIARLGGPAGGEAPQELRFTRASAARAAALEQADLDFAADTTARGIDGWVAWFDVEGAMWRDGLVRGHDAVRAAMSKTLSQPDVRLEWRPVASAFSPAGDLGYTVGEAELATYRQDGAREVGWRGAYVTIWRQQADGTWRVLFDTGS